MIVFAVGAFFAGLAGSLYAHYINLIAPDLFYFSYTTIMLVMVVMVTTCIGHGLMTLSLSLAPASVLQPFNYFSLPWGITLSFVFFGHLIDPISLAGAAVIVGAGLVVMARERRKRGGPSAEAVLPPME